MLNVRLLGIGGTSRKFENRPLGPTNNSVPSSSGTERNARPSCWPRAQVNDESGLISPTTDFFVASVLGSIGRFPDGDSLFVR
jgi:hypothetical protein